MKRFSLIAVGVALALGAVPARLHSQGAAEAVKSPVQLLMELKASNEALIKKQQETLKTLEDLKAQAEQLRIFSKRS